ncbi:hypothetical protein FH144_08480 [Staphylococcus caledonicus]|uniref:hypothetical protein n=1 Tax=Staphylococcus sp. acrmy TaxID=2929076 RepID=UPI001F576C20|nr:hypothetical protein [Staphylococcus sp. acrmy]MCI2948446.1 hypothetical protein [Staphylococcus sp. acrmy]
MKLKYLLIPGIVMSLLLSGCGPKDGHTATKNKEEHKVKTPVKQHKIIKNNLNNHNIKSKNGVTNKKPGKILKIYKIRKIIKVYKVNKTQKAQNKQHSSSNNINHAGHSNSINHSSHTSHSSHSSHTK